MNPTERDLTFLDLPELTRLIFYPRRHQGSIRETKDTYSLSFAVEKDIDIVGRFYCARDYRFAPTILFFHGNGEIATDYDFIGPTYQQMGINFFVADYRGYGKSDGSPSFSNMINDGHIIYQKFRQYLLNNEFTGPVSVMGRSLGSASAIELASCYQEQLGCLIIESGFAYTFNLLKRLGIPSSVLPVEREEEVSTLPLIKNVLIPLLVIHGESDMIIPLEDGAALYKHTGSERKELLIIPRAGHNDLLLRGSDDYMAAVHKIITETVD
ncbi:MAG: alpha/beta hydrolase [Candidatus Heimdallarchaeota archaeon]|nr:MAG: alpha/beta hydrolase [Candidatus Heimdallarchaeota archaeon]